MKPYPDDPIDPQTAPPVAFTDREGRDVEVREYDGEYEAVVEMYVAFEPADRAQGIPPSGEDDIRRWLDTLLEGPGVNVAAWHGDRVVGHATLVPDQQGAYELAIFVQNQYQEAGIGTQLMRALLGAGQEEGIERVWLTVERWNNAAIHLYEKIGFEASDPEGFELEMSAKLAD